MTAGDEHGPRVRACLGAVRTLANLEAGVGDAGVEVGKGIECGKDLHSTDSVQHVGVVARSGAKATVWVEAREDEVEYGATG